MPCTFDIDGEDWTYELNLTFDADREEYVAAYYVDDDMVNVGRGTSVNRAVSALARQMNGDIEYALAGGE